MTLLFISPHVVEPIIGNGERGAKFSGVKEVNSIPPVCGGSKGCCSIAGGILYKNEESSDMHEMHVANLDFGPSSINPFGIIGHSINIGKRLDSHLDISRVVQNTTIAIQEVNNRRLSIITCGIPKNSSVPTLEVGIILNESGKCLPFIGGRKKEWAIWTRGENIRT